MEATVEAAVVPARPRREERDGGERHRGTGRKKHPKDRIEGAHRDETSRLLERLRDVEAVLPDAARLQGMLAQSLDETTHAEHELVRARKELKRRDEGERAFLSRVKTGVEDASRGAERIRSGAGCAPRTHRAHGSAPSSTRRHSPRDRHASHRPMSPNGGLGGGEVTITIGAPERGGPAGAPSSPTSSPSSSLQAAPPRHPAMAKLAEDLAATQAALCRATRDLVLAANARREAEARAREARREVRRERREMAARVLAAETACEERIAMAEEAAGRVKLETDRARREAAREAEGLRADLSLAREAAARLGREASDLRARRARDAEGWVADVASLRRRLASLETRLRCDRLERTVKDPDARARARARAVLAGRGGKGPAASGGGGAAAGGVVDVAVDVVGAARRGQVGRARGPVAGGPTFTSAFGSTRRLASGRPRVAPSPPPPESPPAAQLAGIREALARLGDDLARRVSGAAEDAELPPGTIEIVVEEERGRARKKG